MSLPLSNFSSQGHPQGWDTLFPGRSCLILLGILFLVGTGCHTSPQPRKYEVVLEASEDLGSSTVRVDLVGASPADWQQLRDYPVSRYFAPGNPVRRELDKVTAWFGQGHPHTQTLPKDAAPWKEWRKRGALYLVVLADLPGLHPNREGTKDTRRLLLPLDKHRWPSHWIGRTSRLRIDVSPARLALLTPEKPSRSSESTP